jgi:hypothetical protein
VTETSTFTPEEIAAHRRQWIAALRSGEYMQGIRALRRLPDTLFTEDGYDDSYEVPEKIRNDPTRSTYCCLGVAEQLRGCTWTYDVSGENTPYLVSDGDALNDVILTPSAMRWLGLTEPDPVVAHWVNDEWKQTPLSVLNDAGTSFDEIATLIEAQPDDWDGDVDVVQARVIDLNRRNVRP